MTEIRKMGRAQPRKQSTDAGVKLTTFIPMRIVRHKTNRVIVHPGADGQPGMRAGQGAVVDPTLCKALSRAHYWQQLLDSGRLASVAELAVAESVDRVRVQKTLKLVRLAPDIAEDIARGKEPVGLSLEFFMRRELPDDWNEQRRVIGRLRLP